MIESSWRRASADCRLLEYERVECDVRTAHEAFPMLLYQLDRAERSRVYPLVLQRTQRARAVSSISGLEEVAATRALFSTCSTLGCI